MSLCRPSVLRHFAWRVFRLSECPCTEIGFWRQVFRVPEPACRQFDTATRETCRRNPETRARRRSNSENPPREARFAARRLANSENLPTRGLAAAAIRETCQPGGGGYGNSENLPIAVMPATEDCKSRGFVRPESVWGKVPSARPMDIPAQLAHMLASPQTFAATCSKPRKRTARSHFEAHVNSHPAPKAAAPSAAAPAAARHPLSLRAGRAKQNAHVETASAGHLRALASSSSSWLTFGPLRLKLFSRLKPSGL